MAPAWLLRGDDFDSRVHERESPAISGEALHRAARLLAQNTNSDVNLTDEMRPLSFSRNERSFCAAIIRCEACRSSVLISPEPRCLEFAITLWPVFAHQPPGQAPGTCFFGKRQTRCADAALRVTITRERRASRVTVVPSRVSAPSSMRGLRAGLWRSRVPSSSPLPRDAARSHRRGP